MDGWEVENEPAKEIQERENLSNAFRNRVWKRMQNEESFSAGKFKEMADKIFKLRNLPSRKHAKRAGQMSSCVFFGSGKGSMGIDLISRQDKIRKTPVGFMAAGTVDPVNNKSDCRTIRRDKRTGNFGMTPESAAAVRTYKVI